MNHPVTVRAEEDEVSKTGRSRPARVQRNVVMALDVVRAALSVRLGEVEPARFAGNPTVCLPNGRDPARAKLWVTLAGRVPALQNAHFICGLCEQGTPTTVTPGRREQMDARGMVTVASGWSVGETIDRLQSVITGAGLLVFARIDHAGNAARAGMELRPTQLLIFGNPRGGTALMQDRQTSGIDLPVKALAWQDQDGKVWLTYNRASWLAERHGLGRGSEAAVKAIERGLTQLVEQVVGPTTMR